eukprot:COSAG01_NODE_39243_length_479_cov_0.810526_1_plen_79_part_10
MVKSMPEDFPAGVETWTGNAEAAQVSIIGFGQQMSTFQHVGFQHACADDDGCQGWLARVQQLEFRRQAIWDGILVAGVT